MKHTCELQENLDVKQLLIDEILFEDNKVTGVVVETGEVYTCKAVVLASGTYLKDALSLVKIHMMAVLMVKEQL